MGPPVDVAPAPAPAPALPAGADELTVLRSLFFAFPDSMLVVDHSGSIVMANPSAELLLGYGLDELTGMKVEALVPDAIRSRHAGYRASYEHAPRTRPMGVRTDLVARRKDGTEVMVEIALSPLLELGPAQLVVAAIRDIGAYPRIKQALQRARYSEQLAQLGQLAADARDPQTVIDTAPGVVAAVLEVDSVMVFLLEDADPSSLRVASGVGALPSEQVGARVPYLPDRSPGMVLAQGQPLVVADYRTEARFEVSQTYLEGGLVSAMAVPISDRGRMSGALTVRSRVQRFFGDDELRFLQSVAGLLATSLQRAASEEALNHAQRMESVGQLTGGLAHDFNNLLTVIQGNLQVLDELPDDAGNDYRKQLVAAAMRASKRGAELTAKLLAFSRRQVLQPAPIDIAAMFQSLADMLRRTLDQRIRIDVHTAADRPLVLADPSHLESALLNIAINARDAMPEGGTLTFRAERCGALAREVRATLDDPSAADDTFVAISIGDTGSGMTEEVRARAFEPFFTTKEAGRGTGLGLASVYGFAKQSRGGVRIDSVPGAGTTITLYIPRPWDLDAISPPQVDSSQVVPAGLRVLLVEDDGDVQAVVRTFLDTLGCVVTMASSAEQALVALSPAATFDLLLTDIALGAGMRGTELAALAQKRHPDLAILLMSGFSSELLDADRDSPASWELLRKPYSREELARAIVRVIGHSGPPAP